MLAGVLFYVALIALVTTTILSAGLAMTRMSVARMTQPYLDAGYQRAAVALQERVAAQMQADGAAYPAPVFTPLAPECANAACTYTAGELVSVLQSAPPAFGTSCDPSQSSCAQNVQANPYVDESRIAADVTVEVRDTSGSIVAQRSETLVLRTFAAPPYVAIAGSRESAFDAATASNAAGDDGGAVPATPNPCASAALGIAADTAVRVAYRNQTTSACSDGSAWSNASYGATTPAGGWNP